MFPLNLKNLKDQKVENSKFCKSDLQSGANPEAVARIVGFVGSAVKANVLKKVFL